MPVRSRPTSCCSKLGLPHTLEKIDFATKKTAKGVDYSTINSKGAVPALELDDGRRLTEGPAIVQYLADLKAGLGTGAARRNASSATS